VPDVGKRNKFSQWSGLLVSAVVKVVKNCDEICAKEPPEIMAIFLWTKRPLRTWAIGASRGLLLGARVPSRSKTSMVACVIEAVAEREEDICVSKINQRRQEYLKV
jgi:hypothetical protein